MRVRLLTGLAGRGFSHAPGAVIRVSTGEGRRLIEAGFAEPVEEAVEETMVQAPETAEHAANRRRGRHR